MTASRPAGVPWLTPLFDDARRACTTAPYTAAFGFELRDSVQDDGVAMRTSR